MIEIVRHLAPRNREDIGALVNEVFQDETSEEGFVVWKHPSLEEGPWSKAQFCPGNLLLHPPIPEDQQLIEKLFSFMGQYTSAEQPTQNNGTFDQARLMITVGAYVAETTLYPDLISTFHEK